MIKENLPLSMPEASEYIKGSESSSETQDFIKKFARINAEKAKKLRENIRKLEILKVNEKHISKIIDLMPEDKEEINKIFTDSDLNEDETNKLLETIKTSE